MLLARATIIDEIHEIEETQYPIQFRIGRIIFLTSFFDKDEIFCRNLKVSVPIVPSYLSMPEISVCPNLAGYKCVSQSCRRVSQSCRRRDAAYLGLPEDRHGSQQRAAAGNDPEKSGRLSRPARRHHRHRRQVDLAKLPWNAG